MTIIDDSKNQSKKKKIWVILLSAAAILFLCIASILLYFERLSPSARASLTVQARQKTEAEAMAYQVTVTDAILPTITLSITNTQEPTQTSLPTATIETGATLKESLPNAGEVDILEETTSPTQISEQILNLPALTCHDLERQYENLTELGWERYREEIIGRKITFSGAVIEIYHDQQLEIKDENCRNLYTVLNLFGIPEEDLINIHKGQMLRGEGTIRDVNFVYGTNIDVNVDFFQ
ncbi:MAG: hypothetical protein ACK2TV_16460 [Anaerolineales bacterium]